MLKLNDNTFEFDFGSIRSGKLMVYASVYTEKNDDKLTEITPCNVKNIGTENIAKFLGVTKVTEFVSETENFRLQWKVGCAHKSGLAAVFFHAAMTNLSEKPVYFNKIGLNSVDNEALVCDGDPKEWYLGYNSTLEDLKKSSYEITVEKFTVWGFPIPPKPEDPMLTDGRYRVLGEFVPLFSREKEKGLFITPVGKPEAFLGTTCFVEHEEKCLGQITLHVDSDMSNVLVQPGETRWGQQMAFVFGTYDDVTNAVMRHLADTHGSRVGRPPVAGWCSWYDLYSQITEDTVMSTAKAWEDLKERRPIDVVQIDDGYQIQNGAWDCNEKFPSGWGPFIETVNRAGAIPGIWLAPVCVHDSTEIFKNHPDWFARNIKGELLAPINNWGPSAYWLDVTNPEAFAFAVDTLREKYELGFRYFKIDFNSIHVDGRSSFDSKRTGLQLYRDLYRGYREAIGEDSYLCSCSELTRGTFGFADSSRIGGDSPPVWEDYHDNCLRNCIEGVARTCITNGIIYTNDPDVSFLYPKHFGERPHLTVEELHTWHTVVGLLGGTQMISDAMAEKQSQENLYMMEILTPSADEKARPLYPATDPHLTRFGMNIQRDYGDFSVAMIHNPKEVETVCTEDISTVCKKKAAYHVWSFWDRKYLGVKKEDFSVEIEKHGCKLLRFTPVSDKDTPLLIGSDLHISIGSAEVKNIEKNNNVLEITLFPYAGARDGSLYLYTKTMPSNVTATGVENVTYAMEEAILKVTFKNRSLTDLQSVKILF